MPKTVLERITINNILAFMVVGVYVGIWGFIFYYGIITSLTTGQDVKLLILTLADSLKEIVTTMTIIVVIVIQYHFRTSPTQA